MLVADSVDKELNVYYISYYISLTIPNFFQCSAFCVAYSEVHINIRCLRALKKAAGIPYTFRKLFFFAEHIALKGHAWYVNICW